MNAKSLSRKLIAITGEEVLSVIIHCFMLTAITTSFIGVVWGLFDFLADGTKVPASNWISEVTMVKARLAKGSDSGSMFRSPMSSRGSASLRRVEPHREVPLECRS